MFEFIDASLSVWGSCKIEICGSQLSMAYPCWTNQVWFCKVLPNLNTKSRASSIQSATYSVSSRSIVPAHLLLGVLWAWLEMILVETGPLRCSSCPLQCKIVWCILFMQKAEQKAELKVKQRMTCLCLSRIFTWGHHSLIDVTVDDFWLLLTLLYLTIYKKGPRELFFSLLSDSGLAGSTQLHPLASQAQHHFLPCRWVCRWNLHMKGDWTRMSSLLAWGHYISQHAWSLKCTWEKGCPRTKPLTIHLAKHVGSRSTFSFC